MFGRKKQGNATQLGQFMVAVGGKPRWGGWSYMQAPEVDEDVLPLFGPLSVAALAAYGASAADRDRLFDAMAHMIDEGIDADISASLEGLVPGGSRGLTDSPGPDTDLMLIGEMMCIAYPDGETLFVKWQMPMGRLTVDLALPAIASGWSLGRRAFGERGSVVLYFAFDGLIEAYRRGVDFGQEQVAALLPATVVKNAYQLADEREAIANMWE